MKHDTAHVRAHGWRAHARVPFAICPQMYFCYSSLAVPFRGCTGLTELASVNAQREMLGHFSSANDVKPTDSRLASSVLPPSGHVDNRRAENLHHLLAPV